MKWHKVILLLGSNLGERETHLLKAVQLIEREVGEIITLSSVYETEAWGKTNQPAFLNVCLVLKTTLTPLAVLQKNLATERQLGRVRQEKWGARIIDIDILFYDDAMVQTDVLTIPHEGFEKRMFAIVPLMEIAPEFIHPVTKRPIEEIYRQCADPLKVKRVKQKL